MSQAIDTMNLKQEIVAWDGKSADGIRDIYARNCHASLFVSEILRLTKQKPLQKGTTWLLKRHLEKTGCLEPSDVKEVSQLLPKLEHWETKLHILQCIPYMPIPKTHKKKVETFLKECLAGDAKFVRAWAFSGFYELAVQYPEYQEETKKLFEVAMRVEAASVKARIRRVMKKGFQ
ncbi:MAG: hypothetical protein NPIRA05_03320 [Nitrospirales bacterium]|nr:MAG: hypothetical protein NPIRA05_03320 [Nitrospirales bacterium]